MVLFCNRSIEWLGSSVVECSHYFSGQSDRLQVRQCIELQRNPFVIFFLSSSENTSGMIFNKI